MSHKSCLAFEIGTEEIPAFDLHKASLQLETLAKDALVAARIEFEDLSIYSTPRRLVVLVNGIATSSLELLEEFKGPKVSIAYDAEGNPSKAACGFARSKGFEFEDLEVRSVDGVEYLYASRTIPAKRTQDLLPDILLGLIHAISWPKSCKWGSSSEYFSRPVRWIVALLDDECVPLEFAGVASSNKTCGHRVLSPGMHEVARAQDFLGVLRSLAIVPSEAEREALILEQVAAIEEELGFKAEIPQKTLAEVVNLCEAPDVLCASFDEGFLTVPEEIIVDAMLMHQRYFPLYKNGKLTNKFIIVSNGNPACTDTIKDGNERVVRARLSDAQFFYEEDLKKPLESYVDLLETVVFQESLGSVRQKVARLEDLALKDAEGKLLGMDISQEELCQLKRVLRLCKADLVTNAVIEFTSVQGIMGSYYARAAGEDEVVAEAIAEHYQPRFAGDVVPTSRVGKLAALFDKLDSLCGLFALGLAPTGSSDPFALRRSALGIIAIMQEGIDISLDKAIDASLALFAKQGINFDAASVKQEIQDFFVTRTKVLLKDQGIKQELIDALLNCGITEPSMIILFAQTLNAYTLAKSQEFAALVHACNRLVNLADKSVAGSFDISLASSEETSLYNRAESIKPQIASCLAELSEGSLVSCLDTLSGLSVELEAYLDNTKIMDDDLRVRENRLVLIGLLLQLYLSFADFSLLS